MTEIDDIEKPWAGEFPSEDEDEMDEAAIRILIVNMNAAKGDRNGP